MKGKKRKSKRGYVIVKLTKLQAESIYRHFEYDCICGIGNEKACGNACTTIKNALWPEKDKTYNELCKKMGL